MKANSKLIQEIHERAQVVVKQYHQCEADLVDVLVRAEQHRVHHYFECDSLYKYATEKLKLSEGVAYIFVNVARKVREVPELGTAVREGKITITKARRITSVLNKNNQAHWLHLAETLSKRKLEKLVAEENPRAAVVEKTTFVSIDRIELQVGVSEPFMIKLRRAQDVLSQKKRRPVSLEETLEAAVGMYIDREDPVVIAQRQMVKGRLTLQPPKDQAETVIIKSNGSNDKIKSVSKPQQCPGTVDKIEVREKPGRKALPAQVRHKLNIKFQGQCGHIDSEGKRCEQRRFLDVHHIQPLSQGGSDEIHNLELLCSGHHRAKHFTE